MLKTLLGFFVFAAYLVICLALGYTFADHYPLAFSWFMYHIGGTAWFYPLLICFAFLLIMIIHFLAAYYSKTKKRIAFFLWGPPCLAFALNATIIHDGFPNAKYRDNGILVVHNPWRHCLYDSLGNYLYSGKHDFTDFEFKENCIIVRGEDKKHKDTVFVGILDAQGNRILECEYICDTFAHWNGYVLIHNEKGYGLLSPQSEVVYAPNWWHIYELNTSSGKTYLRLIRQEMDKEKWAEGLGDFSGKIVIPVIYTNLYPVSSRDLCIVERSGSGSRGLISLKLEAQIVPCQFDDFTYLADYIIAKRNVIGFGSLNTIHTEYVIYSYEGQEIKNFSSKEQLQEWLSDEGQIGTISSNG